MVSVKRSSVSLGKNVASSGISLAAAWRGMTTAKQIKRPRNTVFQAIVLHGASVLSKNIILSPVPVEPVES